MDPDQSVGTDIAAAYEGLESDEMFADREAVERYRRDLLARHESQARFVAALLPSKARMLEVGCGNGRLLIALAARLEEGLGLDLAHSRIEFATAWAADGGLGQLQFRVADALRCDYPAGHYDLAAVVTGAFGYFDGLREAAALRLARSLHASLSPRGVLVLELYPHPRYRRLLAAAGGRVRMWRELPRSDPWRFYLSELSAPAPGIIEHVKTFVHRTEHRIDAGRREVIRVYSEPELRSLLASAGFSAVDVYGGWDGEPYEDGETELCVVVARR